MLSDNIRREPGGSLYFADHSISALAKRYGTPLYLMDENRIRENCRMYLRSFAENFGDNALPLYASKAASFKQIYRIMAQEGMWVDAVSPGEIHTAVAAGFPPERIFYHGDGKTEADIRFALDRGVGTFVVDNETELLRLEHEAARRGIRQKILLRVTPGIDPHSYEAVNTGTVDVKFGRPIETGQALAFCRLALNCGSLELRGLHCHVGSQVFDEDVFERTIDIMVGFMALLKRDLGYETKELNVGGGYGVRYLESDRDIDIPARIRIVAERLRLRCAEAGLPLPFFLMEPGRSIVADAGMTVYTVVSVKKIPGYKQYVTVDGGMGDNPRYCLYHAAYTVLHAGRTGEETMFDLVGRCCESGDILQPGIPLPGDTAPGELVAVCTTGAYNYAMASNYNRFGRPPVIMLTPEGSYCAVRRETISDVSALDF